MKYLILFANVLALLSAVPTYSQGLYLDEVYNVDTSFDWGRNVFVENDGNYFIVGGAVNSGNRHTIFVKKIAPDGTQLLSKVIFASDIYSFFCGLPGSVKQFSSGDFLVPISKEKYHPNVLQRRQYGGLARINSNGDVIWIKYYTDSTVALDFMWNCNILPDGGLILVGQRDYYSGSQLSAKALIVRTDSLGNVIWSKVHNQCNAFVTVSYANGNLLIGGRIYEHIQFNFQYDYMRSRPWYFLYDESGNLIADSLYNGKFGGGSLIGEGSIFGDQNGGYYVYGSLDSVLSVSSQYTNHPNYLARVSNDFKIVWIKKFSSSPLKQELGGIKQLKDGSYLLLGINWGLNSWASKINKFGFVEWHNEFGTDTGMQSYLIAADERPDGAIVMTGTRRSLNNPGWHRTDAWVLVVDSNGCLMPNCAPTNVTKTQIDKGEVFLYPNPTTGNFTVKVPSSGTLSISSIDGQLLASVAVIKGENSVTLPARARPGIYIVDFRSIDGYHTVRKLIYQP